MPAKVEAIEGTVVAKGHQQVTSLSTVKTLTVPDGTTFALIQPKTQAVWITFDLTTPASTNGLPLAVGATLKCTSDLKLVKMIEQTTSATVDVAYFGEN